MIEVKAFNVECNNCGRTGSLSLYRGEIISDGSVLIAVDEKGISEVYCKGCNESIEAE